MAMITEDPAVSGRQEEVARELYLQYAVGGQTVMIWTSGGRPVILSVEEWHRFTEKARAEAERLREWELARLQGK